MTFADVPHREKEPLRVVECIMVEVKVQIVLTLLDLFSLSQVSRLELRIEEQCLIIHISDEERFWRRNQLFMLKTWCHSSPLNRLPYELLDVQLGFVSILSVCVEVTENIVWLWMVLQESLRLRKDLYVCDLKVKELVLGDQWCANVVP